MKNKMNVFKDLQGKRSLVDVKFHNLHYEPWKVLGEENILKGKPSFIGA